LNATSETLNRTFSVVEELVFADAKKDPVAAQTYKLVAALNSHFNTLVQKIEETGAARNTALQLEENINKIQQRVSSLNFDRIMNDLKQVKEENAKLIQKYKDLIKQQKQNVQVTEERKSTKVVAK
jgi:TolA-binding protein